MNARYLFGTATWCAALLLACGRQPDQDPRTAASVTAPTGATVTRPIDAGDFDPASIERASREGGETLSVAVHEIAGTFCDHEETCDNVGPHRSYATRQDCVDHERASRTEALRVSACGARLPKASVARCLDILRGTPCVLTDDGASRVPECRAGMLCSPG